MCIRDRFEAAYFNQIAFFVKYWAELSNIGAEVRAKNFSKLVKTVTTYDCVAKGKSLDAGGSRYNFGCVETVGFAAAADALYAIKKLVFEDKVLDAKVLDAAMAANFEGYDAVHRMVQNLPKFGNDVAEVDQLASRLLDHFWAECGKYVSCLLYTSPTYTLPEGTIKMGPDEKPTTFSMGWRIRSGKIDCYYNDKLIICLLYTSRCV